jgi:hypothetical protein
MVSIGLVLSEEKIFEKVYDVRRRRTPSDGNSSQDPSGQVSKKRMLQVKKLISCLPMIGGSLRVLLPPLKLVAMI